MFYWGYIKLGVFFNKFCNFLIRTQIVTISANVCCFVFFVYSRFNYVLYANRSQAYLKLTGNDWLALVDAKRSIILNGKYIKVNIYIQVTVVPAL